MSTRIKEIKQQLFTSHEVGYNIRVQRRNFGVFLFHEVVQKHYLGEVGK